MSASTGVAPQYRTAAAVAANVIAGTITSSPGPTPAARYARCSAAVQEDTASAWRTPRCSANACSKACVRGPAVSQPERSTSATASMSCGSRRRSNSGMSGNVPVPAIEGVREAAVVERRHQLLDTERHGHRHLVAQRVANLLERHLVVARVLLAGDELHLAAVGALADHLDEVELAVVLARVADVEHLAGHDVLRRLEHRAD